MPKKFNARDVAGELDRIHPYSRKASQLRRSQLRSNKIANTKQTYQSHDVELMRLQWFHMQLDTNKEVYSPAEMHDYILEYIHRHEPERKVLLAEQRPGRPTPARLDLIEAQIKQDLQDYKSGFMLPDLTVPRGLEVFRAWDGLKASTNQLRLRRFMPPSDAPSASASAASPS